MINTPENSEIFGTFFVYKSNLKKRILAGLIDYFIIGTLSAVYVSFFGTREADGSMAVHGWLALPVFIGWLIYFVFVEATFGATLGHRLLGLKVLTTGRNKISVGQSLKRHVLDPIECFYLLPAVIAIRSSEKHQRIGDMWAKTIVVDTNDPEQFNR